MYFVSAENLALTPKKTKYHASTDCKFLARAKSIITMDTAPPTQICTHCAAVVKGRDPWPLKRLVSYDR